MKLNLKPSKTEIKGQLRIHRQLTGGQYDLMLKYIHELLGVFNEINQKKKNDQLINDFQLWIKFREIYLNIKINFYKTSESLKNATQEWMKIYLSLYHVDNISVYIHIFSSHLHEFIDLHGNINLFNCEGLEKLNDYSTLEFYRATNKKGKKTNQMLHHRLRVLYFENKFGAF